MAQEGLGRGGDHHFRQVGRLEEEPVPVRGGEVALGPREHRVRGHDVEHAQAGDGIGVVERLAVADAPAAIVADVAASGLMDLRGAQGI